MRHFDHKILGLLLILMACNPINKSDNQLVITRESVGLRADPIEKSQELAKLQKGQIVEDLQEVSRGESQIVLGGRVFQGPWIKVQISPGQSGWVHSSALRPRQTQEDWLLQKRLICYFGGGIALQRNDLMRTCEQLQTENQLADAWKTANKLRDTFLLVLAHRPETGFNLRFNWLEETLPGFIFQKVGAEERPQLFAKFDFWRQQALKTNGLQDDAFFEVCLAAFPRDSIESFFPVWKFQLSETESASQLGTGQHLKMFHQIDQAMAAGPLFSKELNALKNQILEDIFGRNVLFWQSQEKILEELDGILSNPPKCLEANELEDISIRRKMFLNPGGNGIRVNLRSGQ